MIAVGVDTHKHEHLASAIDGLGQVLGALTITTSLRGYGELVGWLRTLGEGVVVGIEGAGSYGAGLCEYLLAEGFDVVKVERPRREDAAAASRMRSMRCWQPRRSSPQTDSPRPAPAAPARRWRHC
ncbi:MAG: transposase [Solirubrobacteraceae bacterium]